MIKKLKFSIFGTGFWARYQLSGWREIGGNGCVAIYNRTLAKAEKFWLEFGISAVYDDAEKLLSTHRNLDFIDIITDADTHRRFVELAAAHLPPPYYPWANSRYETVHASIVDCNCNLLVTLQGTGQAGTTGEDDYKTLRLVYAAYDSAVKGQVVAL